MADPKLVTVRSLPRDESSNPEPFFWNWLDGYLKAVIGISVFGGQITFTVLVSEIADPAGGSSPGSTPTFHKQTVRTFIGISWLLFVLSLGIAALMKTILSDPRERIWLSKCLGTKRFRRLYSTLTIMLDVLTITPFLLLSLVTVAYLPVVGWIGTAFVSLFMVIVGISWMLLDS